MDFEKAKKAYDSMSWQEQQKFAEQNKNNAGFQQFANQYLNGGNPTPSQPQPSNPQPETRYNQNQDVQDGQNWGNNGWIQSSQNQETEQTQGMPQQPAPQDSQNYQFWYWTTEEYRKQRDTQFAQQLYQSNPNTFDYNAVFNYVKSQAPQVSQGEISNTVKNIQRQWLQHSRIGMMGTASVDQIRNGILNGQFSQSDLELLRTQDPQKYQEYLAHDEKLNAMSNAKHNAGLMNKLYNWESVKEERSNQDLVMEAMEKFFGNINYNSKEIVESYKQALNSPEIQRRNSKVLTAQREMDEIDEDLDTMREDLTRQYPWISKTQLNQILYDRSYKAMRRKNELHRDYIMARGETQFLMNLAEKNFEADMKWVELQRAEFTDKYNALGFAKGILEFETPQQKRQAELDQIKKKAQLESELNDINSKDPKIQFNALMKALEPHYKEFGSIILRPQAQVAQDILALAKKEGISVGEAMRKNFTEPLYKKPEYRAMMNKAMGIDPNAWQQEWVANVDKDGNVSYTLKGKWPMPNNLTRGERQAAYKDISNQLGNNPSWLATAMGSAIPDGTTTGQCWEFTNDYLLALGGEKVFWHSLSQKVSKINGTEPKVWSVVVMDTWAKLEDGRPAWHVGIVTKINTDGTIEITDSNWNDDKKKLTHTLSKKEMGMVKGYYYPQGVETSKNYNESMKGYYMELLDAKLTSSELKALWLSSKEQIDAFGQEALQWKQNNQRKYIKEPLETIERLFNNYSSAGSAIWGTRQGAGRLLWGADYLSDYNYIKSNMTLEHLIDLKSRGATFGALSEWELNAIGNSASRIDLLNSEAKFKQELLTMYNWFLSSAGYPEISLEDLQAKAKKSSETTRSQASVFEDLRRKNTRWKQSNEVDLIYKS